MISGVRYWLYNQKITSLRSSCIATKLHLAKVTPIKNYKGTNLETVRGGDHNPNRFGMIRKDEQNDEGNVHIDTSDDRLSLDK